MTERNYTQTVEAHTYIHSKPAAKSMYMFVCCMIYYTNTHTHTHNMNIDLLCDWLVGVGSFC